MCFKVYFCGNVCPQSHAPDFKDKVTTTPDDVFPPTKKNACFLNVQNTCGNLSLPSEDTAKNIFCYTLISIKILPCEGLEPPYFGTKM
jgi:hypothetical protein